MSMLAVWQTTDLGPNKIGIRCPHCRGKAVVTKKWGLPRIHKVGRDDVDTVMIVGRPCTYCFKTSQVPEHFKGGKPRG